MDDMVLFDRNGESCRSSESSCESDGSEHRAPGCNRPAPVDSNGSSLFTGPLFSAFDYEQKKLLANKGGHALHQC